MLPVLPEVMLKSSPGALGAAGLPLEVPLPALQQGVDERPAEEQQAGEAGWAEQGTVVSSQPAPQGQAEASTCLACTLTLPWKSRAFCLLGVEFP